MNGIAWSRRGDTGVYVLHLKTDPGPGNRHHYMDLVNLTTYGSFYVRFNTSASMGASVPKWRSLGCHELGHTAHLGHRSHADDANDNSCMRSEIWPEDFDTHDLDLITAAY